MWPRSDGPHSLAPGPSVNEGLEVRVIWFSLSEYGKGLICVETKGNKDTQVRQKGCFLPSGVFGVKHKYF